MPGECKLNASAMRVECECNASRMFQCGAFSPQRTKAIALSKCGYKRAPGFTTGRLYRYGGGRTAAPSILIPNYTQLCIINGPGAAGASLVYGLDQREVLTLLCFGLLGFALLWFFKRLFCFALVCRHRTLLWTLLWFFGPFGPNFALRYAWMLCASCVACLGQLHFIEG